MFSAGGKLGYFMRKEGKVKLCQMSACIMLIVGISMVVSASPGIKKEADRTASSRIVGGSEAKPGAWPWMTALIYSEDTLSSSGVLCGGSLIHPHWVVTAAHCVKEKDFFGTDRDLNPDDIAVVLGIHDLENDTGQRISIKRIVPHPSYNSLKLDSDIALLELEEDALYPPILPVPKGIVPDGRDAVTMGWGLTESYGESSETLQQISLPIVSNETCGEAYDDEKISEGMMCAGDGKGVKDTCQGDSGGPLIVQEGDRWYLAGIVSWGQGCAQSGYYGVYTRVSEFTDFIYEYVPGLNIILPESAAEGNGLLSVRGIVEMQTAPITELLLNLSSDNPSEISVPAVITIPANSISAMFDITVLDDSLLDGTQTVMITASAESLGAVTGIIRVDDNEMAVLNISVPEHAIEGDGVLRNQGKVSVNAPPDRDISVSLASDDRTEVTVPATVTLPAGQTSVSFDITIVYDEEKDDAQVATITAVVPGWTSGNARIEVTHAQLDFLTEQFDGDRDLTNQRLTFTPDESGNGYKVCREAASDFSTDPAGGISLKLKDDDYEHIHLSQGAAISFYGVSYSSFYVGSNGYITFESGDGSPWESLYRHFDRPRISGLFTDLSSRGDVIWVQLNDRALVTWKKVPVFLGSRSNSFQIEMFFNGVIRITYLEISTDHGIAGLSKGKGQSADFAESDLSSHAVCMCGDADHSGTVELRDAILMLRFMAEAEEMPVYYYGSDVNGDGKTGMAEVIFALKTVAGR